MYCAALPIYRLSSALLWCTLYIFLCCCVARPTLVYKDMYKSTPRNNIEEVVTV